MARIQHTLASRLPSRPQYLRSSEAADVADRWEADRQRDLELSERLGRELLRWLGLVLVVLGCTFGGVACVPEEPACEITPTPGVLERAWCPSPIPVVVVVDYRTCDVATVQAAVDLWGPLADQLAVVPGVLPRKGAERDRTIYVSRGSLERFKADPRIGNTQSWRIGRAMEWARIEVAACDVQVVAHEIGHALGFKHSADVHDLMHDPLEAESWDVPEEMFGAYDRAQGVAP